MYYTDVFLGQVNINNLKKALNAELGIFNNSDDLTQLVHGLSLFMGYPSCVCSLKLNVNESLKDISQKLLKDSEAVKSCVSIKTLTLNCDSCNSKEILCKCCVISCIKELRQSKSKCNCHRLSNTSTECECKEPKETCCKDFLSGLEACLSLLNLQTDLEGCICTGQKCCKDGSCNNKCPVCSPDKSTITGLGLSRPNPVRLAEKLNDFFGSSGQSKGSCGCKCGSGPSCCCLACQNCSESCNSECRSQGCSCASKTSPCPRKVFCQNINSIKVLVGSTEMTCCSKGADCHCGLEGSSNCSGKNCCVVTSGKNFKHSIKCMIRRLVKFFASLDSSSKIFKSCCDLLCVSKTCYFLHNTLKNTQNGDAIKFRNALETLRFAGPCGQELYRTLKDFLDCCFRIFKPEQKFVEDKVKKFQTACSQCSSATKSGQPCGCCSSVTSQSTGSCKACTALSEDSELKTLFLHGYLSSSYDSSASWDSLCSSKPCCSPSCNSCTSGSCPAGGCCEKCPKRLCAKIFLGMLPCLYYGLKILYDRCQDPVTWPDWQKISMDPKGNPSSDLGRFLYAWGYDLDPLKTKKGFEFSCMFGNLFGSDILEKLYKNCKFYFSIHVSDASKSPPSTVRDMLLWLYGLRFQRHFSEFVENCKSLCSPSEKSFHPDAFCYYIYTCCSLLPVAIISFIETSDSTVANFFSDAHSEISKFHYPEDPSELLEKLCEYVRKIYIPLKFLQYQCDRNADQGGWTSCTFGQKCVEALQKSSSFTSSPSGSPSNSGCGSSCSGSNIYLCVSNSHSGKCSSGSCSGSCPHHLLKFLIDDFSESPSSDSPSLFQPPPGYPKMGFKNLSSTAKSGYSLHHDVLIWFCREGFYPLTRLLQFSLCIFRNPPDTLGELFAFFQKFAEALNSKPDLSSKFIEWIDGEPGFYSGSALKNALENLYGSHSNSHPFDLKSLIHCSTSTCGAYLHPLTYNAYNIFIKDFLDTYLSWVCYLAPTFEKKLKDFYNEASTNFKCCLSSSKCEKIVHCPCALPFLYSFGFGFWGPKTLNSGKKSCKNFIDQLKKVLEENSPLDLLIKQIEKFLWHIRLPFFLFVLAFWALVISYFLYVQLYKLDLLHIDSHLHLPRSFKILPSTLFSDASSKLKDLSYFTL